MIDTKKIPKKGIVIAIDGPAGTGKSSATRRLAKALGFIHVDTGALYRAIAFLLVDEGATPEDEKTAARIASEAKLEFKRIPDLNPANRIFADGRDITPFIRTNEVSMAASRVSAIPAVREVLGSLQRRMGAGGNSILEGRDIGTVIFPDADVKFFLTASIDERAKRRIAELEAAGADVPSSEEMKQHIEERDKGDSERAIAPLKKADEAIEVDTSRMTLDEVVTMMELTVKNRLGIK